MHFILSVLRVNSFSLQYFTIDFNILSSPSLLSENKTMSSAQKMLLGCSSSGFCDFMSSSSIFGRSAKKILNNKGLRMHPCFTPRLTFIASVILSSYFIQILSLVYIFLITLKKFPSMPEFFQ